jgi:hypothetical protein
VDASSHGVGGVIFGELTACTPTVFRWKWPEEITKEVQSENNMTGTITNSDLEMAGILILWLVLEGVCGGLREKRIAMLGDNSPSISWVQRLTSKSSIVAEQLVQALALRIKIGGACPLTVIHIEGKRNEIADVPLRSFGSNPAWECDTHEKFLTMFNSMFSLPQQTSWTVFHLNYKVVMRVISALQIGHFDLEEWRRLPEVGKHVGKIGAPIADLWKSIRTCRIRHSSNASERSQVLPHGQEKDTMEKVDRYKVAQSLAQSQPLARRLQWPATTTQQK